jgi:hypothetical protein
MRPPVSGRGARELAAAAGLLHDDIALVLFEDVALARVAVRDREGGAVRADPLVLLRGERDGLAAVHVVALADVLHVLDRRIEPALSSADPLVRLAEGRLVRGLLRLVDPHASPVPGGRPDTHRDRLAAWLRRPG